MEPRNTIIFDFDGTLVDSFPVVLEVGQQVLGGRLTDAEIERLRNMPPKEILKESGIPYYKIPQLLIRGRRLFAEHLHELKIFPGMIEVVATLHQAGYHLCVVSSNTEVNIRKVLQHSNIERYFHNVLGGVGLFSKASAIKKVLKQLRLDRRQAIYIGDEVRDIEAATKSGVPILSVTWGYNGEHILKEYNPNFLATKPKELLHILQTITGKEHETANN